MNCPSCQKQVGNENINIHTDVAQCQSCNHLFKVSENLEKTMDDGFDIKNPPKGAWIAEDMNKIVIGATTRSPMAFFLVPFMVVWSRGSLGGIYGSQILKGEFNLTMSLFGIPFLLGSILFWSLALMAIWGKVEVRMDKLGGKVFTGLGGIGLSKHFTWDEVSIIKEKETNFNYPGKRGGGILLEGKKRISFGSGLSESRRYYLMKSLKKILDNIKSKDH